MTIRLVLADDHPIVLSGLEQLCSQEEDFEVVARCGDGEQTLRAVRQFNPDVLVLDIRMPNGDGLSVLREIKKEKERFQTLTTQVVILTATLNEDEVIEALRLGARGVVLKEMAPHLLVRCVRKVHAGDQWLENASIGRALEKMLRSEDSTPQANQVLTPREMEILKLVISGQRTRKIAEQLFITEGTVKMHLHAIYEKLRVKGRVELMVYARQAGLI